MANNKKNDKIEVEGKVTEVLKGSFYLVELPNGHTVQVQISPYDLTRGIITWNKR